MNKHQFTQLEKTRLESVENFKKQKLDYQTHNIKQLYINNNQIQTSITYNTNNTNDINNINNMKKVKEEEETWFWNESTNISELNIEDSGYFDIKEESKTNKKALFSI